MFSGFAVIAQRSIRCLYASHVGGFLDFGLYADSIAAIAMNRNLSLVVFSTENKRLVPSLRTTVRSAEWSPQVSKSDIKKMF